MESLEKRFAIIEQQMWVTVENVYKLELDFANSRQSVIRLLANQELAPMSRLSGQAGDESHSEGLAQNIEQIKQRQQQVAQLAQNDMQQMGQQVAQPQQHRMSPTVGELSSRVSRLEMKLQQVSEDWRIEINQHGRQMQTRQDSQMYALRASLLDMVHRTIRSEASAVIGTDQYVPVAIGKSTLQDVDTDIPTEGTTNYAAKNANLEKNGVHEQRAHLSSQRTNIDTNVMNSVGARLSKFDATLADTQGEAPRTLTVVYNEHLSELLPTFTRMSGTNTRSTVDARAQDVENVSVMATRQLLSDQTREVGALTEQETPRQVSDELSSVLSNEVRGKLLESLLHEIDLHLETKFESFLAGKYKKIEETQLFETRVEHGGASGIECSQRVGIFDNPTASVSAHSTTAMDHCDRSYSFKTSIWDAAVFIGTKPYGAGGSFLMAFLLLLTLLVQVLYIFLVMYSFTDSDVTAETVEAFRRFRFRIAHNLEYVDTVTKVSLASKLCGEDPTLHVASDQARALSAINKYIPKEQEDMAAFAAGPLLCVLACVQWCVVVECEVKDVGQLATSVLRYYAKHGSSPRTRLFFLDGRWTIVGLSVMRLFIVVMLVLVRLVVAALLLINGLLYVIHTIELRDLVLNAVALQCIFQFDELFYEAFAPLQVVQFIGSLESLPMPQWCFFYGVDLQVALGLLGSAVTLAASVPTLLAGEIAVLREARETLCGGVQSFVFATTVTVPFYQWTRTRAPTDDSKLFSADLMTDSIIRARGTTVDAYYSPDVDESIYSLSVMHSWNLQEAGAARNAMCQNHHSSMIATRYSDVFADKGAVGIRKCEDLVPFCDKDGSVGATARVICPVACGCDLPNSTLVLGSFRYGCPPSCLRQPAYESVLAHANCIDQSNVALSASVAWKARAGHPIVIATEAGWTNLLIQRLAMINRSMIEHGCNAIAVVKAANLADLCDESDYNQFPFRSLRLFCPVSCRCTSNARNCPRHCPATSLAWNFTKL